jgi:hypothetical protein
MAEMIMESVVAIFRFDCFFCASGGIDLKGHMMNKHKWSEEQYLEYKDAYRSTLCTRWENGKPFVYKFGAWVEKV